MITIKEVDVNDNDDLAYLIVAKEAGLPCDRPSKWCASCCCSHTCTKMLSNVLASLQKRYPQISSILRTQTFPQIFQTLIEKYINVLILTILKAAISKRWEWDSSYDGCCAQKSWSHSQDFLILPPSHLYLPSLTSLHNSISPKIAQNRKTWNLL